SSRPPRGRRGSGHLRRSSGRCPWNVLRHTRSARLHPDGAVEPYRLAVEHGVLDDVRGEGPVLGGPTKARGKRDLLAERDARGLGQAGEERGVEEAGGDGEHANAELGGVASDGQRRGGGAAVGGGVGGLADLAVEGGD